MAYKLEKNSKPTQCGWDTFGTKPVNWKFNLKNRKLLQLVDCAGGRDGVALVINGNHMGSAWSGEKLGFFRPKNRKLSAQIPLIINFEQKRVLVLPIEMENGKFSKVYKLKLIYR